jgi:RNA polymerase sigma-70 factor (ECF subfamily)
MQTGAFETNAANGAPDAGPGAGGQRGTFVTTHWSVVLAAGTENTPQARASLEKLCQTYWFPLYGYVRRRGYAEADAKDLTQAFFEWVLERDWLALADQQRGRFRSFLLTAFSRFLINEWTRTQMQKRGGGVMVLPFDQAERGSRGEPADNTTPEQIYERRWALALLDQVMSSLGAEYALQGKADLFAELRPCLLGERSSQPYSALASKLGTTEGAVKAAVHRLRQRYRQLLREEIAHTVAAPSEVEEEMRYLFAVLAR